MERVNKAFQRFKNEPPFVTANFETAESGVRMSALSFLVVFSNTKL